MQEMSAFTCAPMSAFQMSYLFVAVIQVLEWCACICFQYFLISYRFSRITSSIKSRCFCNVSMDSQLCACNFDDGGVFRAMNIFFNNAAETGALVTRRAGQG